MNLPDTNTVDLLLEVAEAAAMQDVLTGRSRQIADRTLSDHEVDQIRRASPADHAAARNVLRLDVEHETWVRDAYDELLQLLGDDVRRLGTVGAALDAATPEVRACALELLDVVAPDGALLVPREDRP